MGEKKTYIKDEFSGLEYVPLELRQLSRPRLDEYCAIAGGQRIFAAGVRLCESARNNCAAFTV